MNQKQQKILLTLFLLSFTVLSSLYLTKPGLQMDEILFANVALGEISPTTYVAKKFGGITFFVLYYIGALKSWIYIPIFKIFGFNYYSIRFPMILLTLVSITLFFKSFRLAFKLKHFAWLALSCIVFEVTLIGMIRTDVAPMAFEYFFKSLSIYLLFKYLKEKKKLYLFLIPIPLLLGIFNKFNFIWYSNAFIFSAFILAFLNKKLNSKRQLYTTLTISLGLVFGMLFLIRYLNPGMLGSKILKDPKQLIEKTKMFYSFWKSIFDGNGFYELQYLKTYFITDQSDFRFYVDGIFSYFFELSFAIFLIGMFVVFKAFLQKKAESKHISYIFFLGLIVIQSLQVLIVSNATNIWHFYMIFPFYSICVLLGIYFLTEKKYQSLRFLFVGLFVIYNLYGYSKYVDAFINKKPTNLWTNKIEDLAAYVKPIKGEFIELEWGMDSQLVCLTKQNKFRLGFQIPDGYYITDLENPSKLFYDRFIKEKNLNELYFIGVESVGKNPKMIALLKQLETERNFKKKVIKEILEDDGTVIFSIFQFVPTN